MITVLLVIGVGVSVVIGQMSNAKLKRQIKSLEKELKIMGNSRDWWRERYIVKATMAKMLEVRLSDDAKD